MGGHRQAWTPAEDAYLRGLWRDPRRGRVGLAAEVLERTEDALLKRAQILGLKLARTVMHQEVTGWQRRHASGAGVRRIAREAGRSATTVRKHLRGGR